MPVPVRTAQERFIKVTIENILGPGYTAFGGNLCFAITKRVSKCIFLKQSFSRHRYFRLWTYLVFIYKVGTNKHLLQFGGSDTG